MRYQAACRRMTVIDDANDLSFPMLVLYPSSNPAELTRFGPFSVHATLNAPPQKGLFPMVVISHGSGGNHLGYLTIAQFLAEQGHVVVMPQHHGNNRNDNQLDGKEQNLRYRPHHVSLALDTVTADPELGQSCDPDRAAVIGHSMGGYTALAAAGGKPWAGPDQPVRVQRDHRIKALVLMAPATPWFTPDGSLTEVSAAVFLMIAEHDPHTPRSHADLVLKQMQGVTFQEVNNAGHFSFLSPFPPAMNQPGFLPATDPPGFDRASFHEQLNLWILQFFEANLK